MDRRGGVAEPGRRRPTRNRIGAQKVPRGFKSSPLRHFSHGSLTVASSPPVVIRRSASPFRRGGGWGRLRVLAFGGPRDATIRVGVVWVSRRGDRVAEGAALEMPC